MGILDTLQQYKQQLYKPQAQQSAWNGLGYTVPTNNVTTQAPSWMQGQWAAPWWGQAAPNTGLAILQQADPAAYQRLMYGVTQAPMQQYAPAQRQQSEADLERQRMLEQLNMSNSFGSQG
jgi:hypothetical protein